MKGGKKGFEQAMSSIGLEKPPKESTNGHSPAHYHLTDMGNAERLSARHGEDLRYVHPWKKWLVWTGKNWQADETGEVFLRAKETVRGIYEEAANADDSAARKALANHATKCEAERSLRAMIVLAESEVPVRVEELDADPWQLNVENGTLNLRTGELREHDREDLITKVTPVEYDPDAKAPIWEEVFLPRILPSEDVRHFLQQVVGYSLTGVTPERVMFILYGLGRNGKSTFLETIRELLGNENGYAMKTPAETLMARSSSGIPNDIARLKGARFVSAAETEANRRLAEALVKEITGNDTITARFMRGEWFDFRPTHKTWLATNHKPQINGTDPAIWDRIRLVPFDVRIPDEEVDPELPDKLRDELPGILAWAVRGCLDWRRGGLSTPAEVTAATEEYRAEEDVLAAFISECCVVKESAKVTMKDLYDAYQLWCEESGEKPEKKRGFGVLLEERGFVPDRGTGHVAIRRGIGLLADSGHDPEPPEGDSERASSGGVTYKAPMSNSQKPCKSEQNAQVVTYSYPKVAMNDKNSSHEKLCPNRGNSGYLSNSEDPPDATDLTPEQQARVDRLVHEGMHPSLAKKQVIGARGAPPDDNDERPIDW